MMAVDTPRVVLFATSSSSSLNNFVPVAELLSFAPPSSSVSSSHSLSRVTKLLVLVIGWVTHFFFFSSSLKGVPRPPFFPPPSLAPGFFPATTDFTVASKIDVTPFPPFTSTKPFSLAPTAAWFCSFSLPIVGVFLLLNTILVVRFEPLICKLRCVGQTVLVLIVQELAMTNDVNKEILQFIQAILFSRPRVLY